MDRRRAMTRERLIEAAVTVFAERGYAGASVRAICQRAKANPAAIKYYFGSKEGLYQEVLRTAAAAFGAQAGAGEQEIDRLEAPQAIRALIRQQLMPLLRRDKIARYLRVFAWENMSPTRTFRQFVATERIPVLSMADTIVGKILPDASREERLVATIWLVNQAAPFIRNRDMLSEQPFHLKFDADFLERLAEMLAALATGGLSARAS
jgi:AcrR family transcriptional regulator